MTFVDSKLCLNARNILRRFVLGGFVTALALTTAVAAQETPAAPQQTEAPPFSSTLVGVVQASGLPVPGAMVTVTDVVSGQGFGTSTDDNGQYVVKIPHPGDYTVSIQMVAFAPSETKVTVTAANAGATEHNDISLLLVSRAPTPPPPPPTAPAAATNNPATATATPPANATTPPAAVNAPPPSLAASGRGNNGNNRSSNSGNSGGRGFQRVDLNQTGDVTGDDTSDTGNAAGNDAATESTVVSGTARQDDAPMNQNQFQQMMGNIGGPGGGPGGGNFGGGDNGGPGGGPGGPGGGPGGGGRGGGPGGFGGPGGGGRGGPGGGGRGGQGLNLRTGQNRFNKPHGNFSINVADSALNALPYNLAPTTTQPLAPNSAQIRYTGTVTTPLKIPHVFDDKGRTSITASFTGNHSQNLNSVTATVPTAQELQGDFQGIEVAGPGNTATPVVVNNPANGQPFTNNTVTGISPVAQALEAFFPACNVGANCGSQTGVIKNNYEALNRQLTNTGQITARVNHNFTNTQNGRGGGGGGGRGGRGRSMNFNFAYSGGNTVNPGTFPSNEGTTRTRGVNIGFGYNQPIFGWLDNFNITYNRSRTQITNLYEGSKNIEAQVGISGVATNPFDWGLPTLSFGTSGFNSLNDASATFNRNVTLTISDGIVRRIGKHNLRFGGDWRELQNDPETDLNPRGAFTFDGTFSGFDFADFLLGDVSRATDNYGGGVFYFHQTFPDLYAQDNWQARGNLTITGGIRWEYVSPYTEQNNRIANLLIGSNFGAVTPVAGTNAGSFGLPASLLKPDHGAIEPRVGIAYKVTNSGLKPLDTTIVNVGYGVNYITTVYQGMVSNMAYQSPFVTNENIVAAGTTPLSLANAFSPAASTNTYGVNPNYRMGYSQIWNLDLQRQIGKVYLLNLDYTGSKGSDLDLLRAPNRSLTGLLYPNIQPYLYETSGGDSTFNGGTVIISRRMSQSLSFRTSYQYSKALDDASSIGGGGGTGQIAQNDLNLIAEKSLSSGSQTNRLNATSEWQLPFGLNHRWLDRSDFLSSAVGDWQLVDTVTWNSGIPLTPTVTGLSAIKAWTYGSLRPSLVPGQTVAVASPTWNDFFNAAAYSYPTPTTTAAAVYGNAGRHSIIGPDQFSLNTQLSKTFRISEFQSLDLQFQANNVMNHFSYSGINTVVNTPTAGYVTSMTGPRTITFTARYRF